VPVEIHTLVKDAHDQNAIVGLAVEKRMAGGFYLSVAGTDMDSREGPHSPTPRWNRMKCSPERERARRTSFHIAVLLPVKNLVAAGIDLFCSSYIIR
jgi:hypothetical protein